MSRKSRKNIRYTDTRAVLTEVLPFETPISFNNRGFNAFLNDMDARFEGDSLVFRSQTIDIYPILQIIFGNYVVKDQSGAGEAKTYRVGRKGLDQATVPLNFNIRHKKDDHRRLSIPHPSTQLATAGFYKRYRSLILLHSNHSQYSVRYPQRSARYTIVKDSVFHERYRKEGFTPERGVEEYDKVRSYFVYNRYSNIHEFYDSDEYFENEKRFGWLLKLDIQKCFDSVYTHSIEWALYGKDTVKNDRDAHSSTFAQRFDVLIRSMNDDETHGILIGPEVSRLFAEVILQRIDVDIQRRLEGHGLESGRDYLMLRYVDDYFVFLKDTKSTETIVQAVSLALREFRFHLNTAKQELSSTPLISDLSIAKNRMHNFIHQSLRLDSEIRDGVESIFFRSSTAALIAEYKTILKETGLDPLDLANYTLSTLEYRVEAIIAWLIDIDFGLKGVGTRVSQNAVGRILRSTLEMAFFVYGGSPRVTPGIKLVRVAALCRTAISVFNLPSDLAHTFDDLVYRECIIQLRRGKLSRDFSVEALYLLALLGELGPDYCLSEVELCEFVGIEYAVDGTLKIPEWFGPLVIFELMRYIAVDPVSFFRLKDSLENWCIARIKVLRSLPRRTSEEVFLALGMISCPEASKETKWQILKEYSVRSRNDAAIVTSESHRWFTNWGRIDFLDELQAKRVQEVY